MKDTDYVDGPFGSARRDTQDRWGFTYYLPRPIPRHLTLDAAVVTALSDADAALGQLQGFGTLIRDPSLLIGPYLRREALASTRIEGTQASLSEVLQAEVDRRAPTEDVLEVQRYLEAAGLAHELASRLPITQRLILQVHEALLHDVRGEERRPGEYRTSPVWIGPAGATPETAPFVPPLPGHLPGLLSDWEKFVNDDGDAYPALVQAALSHYQFETIHPFLDGNGRLGRLLINLQVMRRGRLSQPLLYLSSYFEAHRSEYYDRLQGVRERGDIDRWLIFFLRAVHQQAADGVARSSQLVAIRQDWYAEALTRRSNLPRLVDIIMRNPVVSVKSVEQQLGLTNQGARNLIRSAAEIGWLTSLGAQGRGVREYWYSPKVLDILEAPMAYRADG